MNYNKQTKQNACEKIYDALQTLGYNPGREKNESTISFQYEDSKYVFAVFEDRMEFLEPYWASLSSEDPTIHILMDVVNQANNLRYSDIVIKMMRMGEFTILNSVFSLTDLPDDCKSIIERCVFGFKITKEWVVSHFLCEIENNK